MGAGGGDGAGGARVMIDVDRLYYVNGDCVGDFIDFVEFDPTAENIAKYGDIIEAKDNELDCLYHRGARAGLQNHLRHGQASKGHGDR